MTIREMQQFIEKGYTIKAVMGKQKAKVSIIQNQIWIGRKPATKSQLAEAQYEFSYQ